MWLSDLGQRIRARRERLGLKQHDLARALQVSPQAVSKWERGENGPDLAILGTLARVLGVSTDWLLGAYSTSLDVFDATVFASAVVGAYEKSRHMAAREFATWANGCFYQLTEVVLRHDGVPIKYMGDAFLAFFSGFEHRQRAVRAAALSRRLSSENLVIGLSSGEIYLGAMGHPDYARPDVMGEVVNVAFLVRDWAEPHTRSGIAATVQVTDPHEDNVEIVQITAVHFKGIPSPICVCELRQQL
jgi:class 3 adenylate cyclase